MERIEFDAAVMSAGAASPYLGATDLAEYLVRAGMPFRDAHAVVGDLVRRALVGEASLMHLVAADPRLGPDAAVLLAPGAAVGNRTTPGGAGPIALAPQLDAARGLLERQAQWLAG
jgi:argininosuccinate lyase